MVSIAIDKLYTAPQDGKKFGFILSQDWILAVMRAVLAILFGASLTVATAWSLGAILLRKLSLTLYRAEERLFAFLLGPACLSAIMFVLASSEAGAQRRFACRLGFF